MSFSTIDGHESCQNYVDTYSHLIRGVCLSEYTGTCVDDEDEDVVVEDDNDDKVRGNDSRSIYPRINPSNSRI